jgi:hypothetical protein
VRLLDERGFILDIQAARPAPTRASDRTAIARQLTAQSPYPSGRLWQIWAGTAWQHLTDAHPETPASDPADDNAIAASLVRGQRYRLRYRSETQRRDRTAVMVYLGADGDQLLFDARPAAGTQRMPRAWLRAVEPVPADTPAHINKIVR